MGERKQLELQHKKSTRKNLGNIKLEGWGQETEFTLNSSSLAP